MLRRLSLLAFVLAICACSYEPEPPPPASAAVGQAPAAADPNYAGKGTVYDTQFKALHDAKQLGAKMNADAARLDEQIDPENNPPQQ